VTTVSEDFSGTLSNWAQDSGSWTITSGYLYQSETSGAYRKLRWTGAALSGDDVAVQAVVRSPSSAIGVGVYARGTTDSTVTYYGLVVFATAGVYLVEITGGSESVLASWTASPPAADTDVTLRLECEGSSLRGYVNGTERLSATDATLSSGSVGMMSYGGGLGGNRADDWTAYDLTPAAPTAPAYIGSTTNGSSTTGTSLALSLPSGAQAGDLLVAALVHENANPAGLSGPSGWTPMSSSTPSGTARALRLTTWYRVMQSGDTGPWSWTTTTAYERGGIMAAYRYADVPTVWASSTTNSSSVNAVAPSITTGAANALVLVAACSAYGTTWTAPTDYTERADYRTSTGASNVSISLHERLRATAGATGTATAVAALADYWVAAHVELPFQAPGVDLAAAVAAGTDTPTAALAVSRAVAALAAAATSTPTAALDVAAGSEIVVAGAAGASTSTPTASLGVSRAVGAGVAVATASPAGALAVTRGVAVAAAGISTTATAQLAVTRRGAALVDAATGTAAASLTVVGVVSLSAAVAASSAAADGGLAVARGVAAGMAGASTTGTAVLGLLLRVSGAAAAATVTPTAALAVVRRASGAVGASTATAEAPLSIAGLVALAAAMAGQTGSAATLAVLRAVAGAAAVATSTPTASLDRGVVALAQVAALSGTAAADLRVARAVGALMAGQSVTADAALYTAAVIVLVAQMGALSATAAALLRAQLVAGRLRSVAAAGAPGVQVVAKAPGCMVTGRGAMVAGAAAAPALGVTAARPTVAVEEV
jgi:hypothetical protein